jgi:hypothetical protein
VRWHYRDPMLVWLFPLAYALHILEEWVGGFPEWLAAIDGDGVSRRAFVLINTGALILMVAAARASTRREEQGWLAIAIAAIVLVNGLLHVVGTLYTGTYSPGLVTSVILYLPLGQLALLRAWQQAASGHVAAGICTGVALLAIVSILAFAL